MKAPRVLVNGLLLGQPMGGVRRHNQELLPRAQALLAERGGSLTLLEGALPARLTLPEAIERVRCDVPPHPLVVRALREGRVLRGLCAARPRRFDLVHGAHLPVPRGLALPVSHTLHDTRRIDLAPSAWRARLARAAIARSLARATLVIAVSETMAARFRRELGAPRVAVVPNGGDHLPLLERAPAPTPFLLHVGHLEPRKNVALLLEALARDPALPELWLVGAAKGRQAEALAAQAARLGLSGRVRRVAADDDRELARLYARTACVVLPSRLEGFGIAALEAQRAGAPLAVAEAGALPEVAPDAPRFAPDDPRGCADAIRRALAQPAELLEARARAAAARTWDAAAAALVAAWCSIGPGRADAGAGA